MRGRSCSPFQQKYEQEQRPYSKSPCSEASRKPIVTTKASVGLPLVE